MATYKIYDRTDEFRIDLIGRFAGGCVNEIRALWQKRLSTTLSGPFIVNLTRVSGYDREGRQLLYEMHRHGVQFAAGTPDALVLLGEISNPMPAQTPPFDTRKRMGSVNRVVAKASGS